MDIACRGPTAHHGAENVRVLRLKRPQATEAPAGVDSEHDDFAPSCVSWRHVRCCQSRIPSMVASEKAEHVSDLGCRTIITDCERPLRTDYFVFGMYDFDMQSSWCRHSSLP